MTRVDIIVLYMVIFDVILCVVWLASYHAILEFNSKNVTISMLGLSRLD